MFDEWYAQSSFAETVTPTSPQKEAESAIPVKVCSYAKSVAKINRMSLLRPSKMALKKLGQSLLSPCSRRLS